MLKKNLRQNLDEIAMICVSIREIPTIDALHAQFMGFETSLPDLFDEDPLINNQTEINLGQQIRAALGRNQISSVFITLNTVTIRLTEQRSRGFNVDPVLGSIEEFENSLQKMFGMASFYAQLLPVFKAERLWKASIDMEEFARSLLNLMSTDSEINDAEQEISLQLSNELSFNELVEKLVALKMVYSEICRLLDVSTSEYPLRIQQLELGSLWLILVGSAGAIGLMRKLIQQSAEYVYRTFTNEGKIVSVSLQAKAVDEILELANRLEKAGKDPGAVREQARLASITIAKRLNTLLKGEPEIEINGVTLSIGEELDQKFLERSKQLFLEPGDSEELADPIKDKGE
jgi:hypothetical protein